MKRLALLLAPITAVTACGGDDGGGRMATCAEGEVSLEILAPMEGEEIDMSHDVDPGMPGLQYELVVAACGIEPFSAVEVFVTEPFESRYATIMVESGSEVVRAVVPLVPGDLTMEARNVRDTVRSPPVSFHVTVE